MTVLLRRLCEDDDDTSPLIWRGFGRAKSPLRDFFIGYTALELDQFALACTHLRRAIDAKAFGADERMPFKHALDDQIQAALARAQQHLTNANRI